MAAGCEKTKSATLAPPRAAEEGSAFSDADLSGADNAATAAAAVPIVPSQLLDGLAASAAAWPGDSDSDPNAVRLLAEPFAVSEAGRGRPAGCSSVSVVTATAPGATSDGRFKAAFRPGRCAGT